MTSSVISFLSRFSLISPLVLFPSKLNLVCKAVYVLGLSRRWVNCVIFSNGSETLLQAIVDQLLGKRNLFGLIIKVVAAVVGFYWDGGVFLRKSGLLVYFGFLINKSLP